MTVLFVISALSLPAQTNVDSNQTATLGEAAVAEQVVEPPPVELPFGGRRLIPEYRFVALYGTPSYAGLGALGEQSLSATIKRARALAAKYQPYSEEPIIPTLEIITTVASAYQTENGDYSQEIEPSKLKTWVEAATEADIYVLLDLQPGRTSFLTQAKQYESLLKYPNVGLALDPEWRLKSNQFHLNQIGSVDIKEVNRVSAWLAKLVKDNDLPQKMFLLHQFRTTMIANRNKLNTSSDQLAFVIQMDGQGSQAAKLDTWKAITATPPFKVSFGWKNFYDEDSTLLPPVQVMKLSPKPWYISYQ